LINAAAHEYSKGDQKSLLNAAAFGKAFLDYYPPEYFMKACKSLRIMNALRDSSIGLPITYEQYNSLGPNEIIRRLCARNQHLLAFRVAEYLKLSVNTIINDWVAKKIQIQSTKVSDAEFCEVIFEQLGQYRGIAVAEIAMIAYKSGRPGLASKVSRKYANNL
jgi:hypothetical protein